MLPALLLAIGLAAAGPGSYVPPSLPGRWAYDEVWMGGAWEAGVPGGGEFGTVWDVPVEFDLAIRNVSDGPFLQGYEVDHRLRLSRDENGRTVVDELSLQGRILGLSIRPAMGDRFDLSLGGRWNQNVYGMALPWMHLQVYVPLHLVPVGFSDTDADSDTTLRYYAAAGAGVGADWLVRLGGGPIGLRLRAEGAGDTMHRVRHDPPDQVRHEVWAHGEADLVLVDDEMPFTFGVWVEHRTQWEPRDAPDGVDRQVNAAGLRFGLRLFRPTQVVEPGGWNPGIDGNPGNARAIARAERREARTNAKNSKHIAAEPEEGLPEEIPPPATPEEHDANNAANGGG